uniref:Ribosome hibernation promoting factor n=1 Tax=Candidatus Kentrum sp. TC TaxID=2126339 RepID=A0A451AB52_9GAMM|nr:MAG: putative sigma-54 modulation protein [Candidatus Kentron sp. TC]VFK50250.1 MAG: SSU ribosomal protein S30P /sigma 54 modulation protein [Candidatus Kentron sp. TC]VFK63270.1 MAG: putative sigma-54 modulation protein [Candidatus Kentron sp. TC]
MQINLTGQNIEITQALRDYINNKFARLERRYDYITSVHVVLGIEKLRQKAEATIYMSRGNLHAEAEAEDMYASIDGLMDKLDRQIKRYKEKRTDHRKDERNDAGTRNDEDAKQ